MTALGQYIISVSGAALISGILCGLLEGGMGKALLKLLCGLFLTITVLQPLMNTEFSDIINDFQWFSDEAAANSAYGQEMAEAAVTDIIKQETQAYIMDKAAALQAEITVDVTVEEGIPVSVKLEGSLSPYSKAQLESILETELGISKENQLWT